MFNGRLQPKRTALAVRVPFLLLSALGVAAGVCAAQTPANTPPSTDKVKAPTSLQSAKVVADQPMAQRPGKGKAAAERSATGAAKTTEHGILETAAGRRDPFKAWVVPSSASHSGSGGVSAALPAGTRGLVISGLRLEGVVRQEPANTMIAVVTNYTNRAYFLKINDTVYNGVVSKITPDAIYFKEDTLDSSGRVVAHEVEIKLVPAPGEGRR